MGRGLDAGQRLTGVVWIFHENACEPGKHGPVRIAIGQDSDPRYGAASDYRFHGNFIWLNAIYGGDGEPRRGFTALRSLEIDWILPPKRKLPPPTLNYECGDFSLNGKRQTCASHSEDIGLVAPLFSRLLAFYFFTLFIVSSNSIFFATTHIKWKSFCWTRNPNKSV